MLEDPGVRRKINACLRRLMTGCLFEPLLRLIVEARAQSQRVSSGLAESPSDLKPSI